MDGPGNYKLYLNDIEFERVRWNTLEYMFKNLNPNSTYHMRIEAWDSDWLMKFAEGTLTATTSTPIDDGSEPYTE